MLKLFIGFLNADQLAALKAAGHDVVEGIAHAAQAAETAVINSPVGSKIADAIRAVASKELTGAQKFEAVLADAIPLVASLASGGGASLVASVEDTARGVIQTLFNATVGAVTKGVAEAGAAVTTPAKAA